MKSVLVIWSVVIAMATVGWFMWRETPPVAVEVESDSTVSKVNGFSDMRLSVSGGKFPMTVVAQGPDAERIELLLYENGSVSVVSMVGTTWFAYNYAGDPGSIVLKKQWHSFIDEDDNPARFSVKDATGERVETSKKFWVIE